MSTTCAGFVFASTPSIGMCVGKSSITIQLPSGVDLSALQAELQQALTPTQAELVWAGNVVKTGIVTRTAQGVDYQGQAFHPYSTNGPYYWYPPNVRGHIRSHKSRLKAKKSNNAAMHEVLHNHGIASGKKLKQATKRVFGKLSKAYGGITTGMFHLTRDGFGIKFASYAAAKTAFGRIHVDLTGLDGAPHMMQQIEVRMAGSAAEVGIWDEFAAAKATGHNQGNPRTNLPQRQFFEASENDVEMITTELAAKIQRRVSSLFGV